MENLQTKLHARSSLRWISKTPPKLVKDGDHWVKEEEGTLWQADVIKREWLPIKATTFEVNPGPTIPFPPKTKVYTHAI